MGLDVPEIDKEELENKITRKRLEYIDAYKTDNVRCSQLEKELEELEKILHDYFPVKDNDEDYLNDNISDALELYKLYEKADPTVRTAIDTLLKKN